MFIYRLSATYLSKQSNLSNKNVILRNGPFWYFSPVTVGIVFCIDNSINDSNYYNFVILINGK